MKVNFRNNINNILEGNYKTNILWQNLISMIPNWDKKTDDEKKFNEIISSYVVPRMSLLNLPINRLIGSLHDILPVDPLIYKLTKSEINCAPYEQQKIILEIINKSVQNTKIDTKIDSKLNTEISFKKIIKKNNPTQVLEIA